MLGWDLRLRLQEDYRRPRVWVGSEASTTGGLQEASCLDGIWGFGVYKLSWQSKTRLENPIVVAPWTPRNHGGAGI